MSLAILILSVSKNLRAKMQCRLVLQRSTLVKNGAIDCEKRCNRPVKNRASGIVKSFTKRVGLMIVKFFTIVLCILPRGYCDIIHKQNLGRGPRADRPSRRPALAPTGPRADRPSRRPALAPTGPRADRPSRRPALAPTGPRADRPSRRPALAPTGPRADRPCVVERA